VVDAGRLTWWFEYGTTTTYGKTTAKMSGTFTAGAAASATAAGLTPGTAYHARLCETDSQGQTGCARDVVFVTAGPGNGDIACGDSKSAQEVLLLHPGGWVGGAPGDMRWGCDYFAARGYYAVGLNYPLFDYTGAAAYAQAAARSGRAAGRRVVALGYSAGASLSSVLAGDREVDAAVNMAGPLDYVDHWPADYPSDYFLSQAGMGHCTATDTSGCAAYRTAQPISHMSATSSPQLLVRDATDDMDLAEQPAEAVPVSPANKMVTLHTSCCGHLQDLANFVPQGYAFLNMLAQKSTLSADRAAPSTPTGLRATVTTATTTATWAAGSDQDLSGYRVYLDGKLAAQPGADATAVVPTPAAGGTHTVDVRAYDLSGNLSPAATTQVVTAPVATPSNGSPTGATARTSARRGHRLLSMHGRIRRPVRGRVAGTAVTDLVAGAYVGREQGILSLLGRTRLIVKGAGRATASGIAALTGTVVAVASRGDRLTGTAAGTATFIRAGRCKVRLVVTITGGTGRFTHAKGRLATAVRITTGVARGRSARGRTRTSITGWVSY